MQQLPIITLTTDFGYKDPLAAIMKGVILSINPLARVIDLTHNIGKFNVREAALIIGMSYREFPPRSVHVVVTDPGVGSQRRPLLVATEDHYLIGPDNGVFSFVYKDSGRHTVYHLTADHYFGKRKSMTFHGRDIFAPVAAWVTKGIGIDNVGEKVTDYVRFLIPEPSLPTKSALEGEIMYIDTFGNAVTNITARHIEELKESKPGASLRMVAKGKEIGHREFYSQAQDKGLYFLINSTDHVELFVFRGSAAKDHELRVGDGVGIILS